MDQNSIVIIAEAGVNHNGSLDTALKLIDAASTAGADFVKFQTFKTENLVTLETPKAKYQMASANYGVTQYEMLKALELTEDDHFELLQRCKKRKIEFLSTPFDLESLVFLHEKLGQKLIKIGSGDITNAPLLYETAKRGRHLILSTGMSTLDEIEKALSILAYGYLGGKDPSLQNFSAAFASPKGKQALQDNVVLLHCTTDYPAPYNSVNLRAMETLKTKFGLNIGYSDHSLGSSVSISAAILGAWGIEKHITLDCLMEGPDHAASMEAIEFAKMVADVRAAVSSLGDGEKKLTKAEITNKNVIRKTLVCAKSISKGEILTTANLTVKRAGKGISALEYFNWLGTAASRSFSVDEPIQ
jgi:N-acetylneuraminate synthase